jgi:hypothetical protein
MHRVSPSKTKSKSSSLKNQAGTIIIESLVHRKQTRPLFELLEALSANRMRWKAALSDFLQNRRVVCQSLAYDKGNFSTHV